MRVLRIKSSYFLCNEEDPDKMILLTFASANLVDASTELQITYFGGHLPKIIIYFGIYKGDFKNTKKPVYSQSTNPCKAILLEYIPTF